MLACWKITGRLLRRQRWIIWLFEGAIREEQVRRRLGKEDAQ